MPWAPIPWTAHKPGPAAAEKEEINFYAKYWYIWMHVYSLPLEKRMEYFEKAVMMMKGVSNSSWPISYIILRVEQMRKEQNYDN